MQRHTKEGRRWLIILPPIDNVHATITNNNTEKTREREDTLSFHAECYNATHSHQSKGRQATKAMVCEAGENCLLGGIIKEGQFFTWSKPRVSSAAPPQVEPTPVPPKRTTLANSLRENTSLSMSEAIANQLPSDVLLRVLVNRLGPNLSLPPALSQALMQHLGQDLKTLAQNT